MHYSTTYVETIPLKLSLKANHWCRLHHKFIKPKEDLSEIGCGCWQNIRTKFQTLESWLMDTNIFYIPWSNKSTMNISTSNVNRNEFPSSFLKPAKLGWVWVFSPHHVRRSRPKQSTQSLFGIDIPSLFMKYMTMWYDRQKWALRLHRSTVQLIHPPYESSAVHVHRTVVVSKDRNSKTDIFLLKALLDCLLLINCNSTLPTVSSHSRDTFDTFRNIKRLLRKYSSAGDMWV